MTQEAGLHSDPGLLHQTSRLALYRDAPDDALWDAWLGGLAHGYPIPSPSTRIHRLTPLHPGSPGHESASEWASAPVKAELLSSGIYS